MNWLCDSCGYENEYKKGSKITECICCGDPAPISEPVQPELKKVVKESETQKTGKFVKFISGLYRTLLIAALLLIGLNMYLGNISIENVLSDVQKLICQNELKETILSVKEKIVDQWFVYKEHLLFGMKNLVDKVFEIVSLLGK